MKRKTKMNRISITLILGIIAVITINTLLGCGSNRKHIDDLIGDGDEIRIYEVLGMDCPGCHGGLENLINKIPGVKGSEANWEKQQLRVVIDLNAEVSDQAIFEAIKQANFTPGKRLR